MHILDILFPPFCQGCGRFRKWICARCWRRMSWCDRPEVLPKLAHPSLRKIWSLCEYDEHMAKILHTYKYKRARVLAQPLGDALAQQSQPWLHQHKIEALIPVPLHPKRQRARGFNQTVLLAERLSCRSGIPTDTTLLHRTHWQQSQAGQDKNHRHHITTAFRCTRRSQYKTVCLVDDVHTTGATLSACARALNAAGVRNIYALTVARA